MVQENEIIWTNNSLLGFSGIGGGARISRWIDFLIPLRFIRGRRTKALLARPRPQNAARLVHTARTRHLEISGNPQVLFCSEPKRPQQACRLQSPVSSRTAGSVISRLESQTWRAHESCRESNPASWKLGKRADATPQYVRYPRPHTFVPLGERSHFTGSQTKHVTTHSILFLLPLCIQSLGHRTPADRE